jgi:hypothetical protein
MTDPTDRDTWTRIAPGVYDDHAGGLHMVLPELLLANGYADTPENRETLLNVAREIFGIELQVADE